MDTFVVIPAVVGFVRFISVLCIDLMQEMRSEKEGNFFLEQVMLLGNVERN